MGKIRTKNKCVWTVFAVTLVMLTCSCGKKTDFNHEIVIKVPGIDKEYDYALINDMHLFIGDEEIIEEKNSLVVSRINDFSFDGRTAAQNFDLWISNLDDRRISGLILNADIIDQMSYSNLNHVANVLSRVKVPYMYLQSDHDLATDWTDPSEENYKSIQSIQEQMDFNREIYVFEEEKFIVLGINYSWRNISESALNEIKTIFDKNKPIIIFTHVPYDSLVSDQLRELSKEKKNDKVLLWGTRGDNFYYPNEYMLEYLNMISDENSPVIAIVAAHLHENFETYFSENISEYITGTSYSGVRTLIRIVPEE